MRAILCRLPGVAACFWLWPTPVARVGQGRCKTQAAQQRSRARTGAAVGDVSSRLAARLSDEPTLTLEIDYSARESPSSKPEFGSALGEFVIRDFREPLPRVEGDRQVLQQIYTLEPTRAGKIRDRSDQRHASPTIGRRLGQGTHAARPSRSPSRWPPPWPRRPRRWTSCAGRPIRCRCRSRRPPSRWWIAALARRVRARRPRRGGLRRRRRMRSAPLPDARRTGLPGIAAIAGERDWPAATSSCSTSS